MTPFYEMDDEVPQLDPVLVADDLELAEVIEQVVLHNPVAMRRAAEIDDYIAMLRRGVDSATWKLVREIQARNDERWTDLGLVLALVNRLPADNGGREPMRVR